VLARGARASQIGNVTLESRSSVTSILSRLSPNVLVLALGLIIAVEGALNLAGGLAAGIDHLQVAFGAAELAGAVMLPWPRTLPAGGCVLFCTFIVATVVHASGGDFPSEHLVYAVAVLFAMSRPGR
jgi:hypothetical protein